MIPTSRSAKILNLALGHHIKKLNIVSCRHDQYEFSTNPARSHGDKYCNTQEEKRKRTLDWLNTEKFVCPESSSQCDNTQPEELQATTSKQDLAVGDIKQTAASSEISTESSIVPHPKYINLTRTCISSDSDSQSVVEELKKTVTQIGEKRQSEQNLQAELPRNPEQNTTYRNLPVSHIKQTVASSEISTESSIVPHPEYINLTRTCISSDSDSQSVVEELKKTVTQIGEKRQSEQNTTYKDLPVSDIKQTVASSEISTASSIVPHPKYINLTKTCISSDSNSQVVVEELKKTVTQIGKKRQYEQNLLAELPRNPEQNTTYNLVGRSLEKTKKRRIVCKFCHLSVTNFERHLSRHHQGEEEVQDFLKFPKNTKEGRKNRRDVLSLLRNEIDFQSFVESEYNADKLPCVHCKRIVSAKYLRRHSKKCIVRPINEPCGKVHHQAASQTLLVYASQHANATATLRVKNEVFSRMACDEIGYVARKDSLIRHFGEHFLKKHKRAQLATACSNKMRECSRLLIEMRRRLQKPELTFFHILNPVLFDDVALCAKAISGYDAEKKVYRAPSLGMHMGTNLQKICELATHLLLRKNTEFKCINLDEKLKEIKRFRFLVQSQWTNEVSSLAVKDLAEKKWNRPVLLPLTEDVMKFRNHILGVAENSFNKLNQNKTDQASFKKLVQASLALTILFTRRRIGDVQYVEIDSYSRNFIPNNQTEFLENLTESERTLTTNYKRVVAGGKGSRAIVILFPSNVQNFINLILEVRSNMNIFSDSKKYLFAYPGVTCARGDVILRNFAKSSKIIHPEAMTSNRLRKQIATLMQLLNLDKSEYAQFARFMGHTEKTHQEFYELTQDAYQTAKVAKLLILFDKGKGTEYKEKELHDIDIDPNVVLIDSDEDTNVNYDDSIKTHDLPPNLGSGQATKKQDRRGRIRWTSEQKKLVTQHFKKHIKDKTAPKKHECEELIYKNQDILHPLDWVRIKTFVYNTYVTEK